MTLPALVFLHQRKRGILDGDGDGDDDRQPSPPLSRRLAFVGEFNSTPYVIVSPRVQKQLIYDAKRSNRQA